MFFDAHVPTPVLPHLVKKASRFLGGFQGAHGFGFQPEVKFFTGASAEMFQMIHAFPQMLARLSQGSVRKIKTLVRDGHRTDASFHTLREHLHKQIKEQIGIIKAFL